MSPFLNFTAVIAQLVRAQDCESWGRGFESRWPPHFIAKNFSNFDCYPKECVGHGSNLEAKKLP